MSEKEKKKEEKEQMMTARLLAFVHALPVKSSCLVQLCQSSTTDLNIHTAVSL